MNPEANEWADTIPIRLAGTITYLRYHFAYFPVWCHDIGFIWFTSYQTREITFASTRVRKRYGLWTNFYCRSWTEQTACKGDGKFWMVTDLPGKRPVPMRVGELAVGMVRRYGP